MLQPYKDGKDYQHNYRNRYLTEEELQKPSQNTKNEQSKNTQQALEQIMNSKSKSTTIKVASQVRRNPIQYISYTPDNQQIGTNSGAKQRIIKMHERQVDPIAPAQFKHKRVAPGPPSPPPVIMHSPPRKLTQEDQANWKIPPCISNWKNAKGYTIPLEMRLKADGRTAIQHTINDKFAKFNNALYMAEREARVELEERNQLIRTMAQQELKQKDADYRKQAEEARDKSNKLLEEQAASLEIREGDQKKDKEKFKQLEEFKRREELRYIEKREIERQMRLEAAGAKKAKQVRDQERDISEKVALGQAQPTQSREVMFDSRLFNQTSGLDAGFGSDDENKIYDKELFADRTNANIYKNTNEIQLDDDEDNNEVGNIIKGSNNKNNKHVSRNRPVEFEKEAKNNNNDDYFQMDSFITDKTQKKLKK